MPEFRCEQKVGLEAEGMAVQRLGDGSPGRPGHGTHEEHTLTPGWRLMITKTRKEVWSQVKGTCGSSAEMEAGTDALGDGKQQRILEQGENRRSPSCTPGSSFGALCVEGLEAEAF